MILEETQKSKFTQINYRRYDFSDSIVSLSCSHSLLKKILRFKEEKRERIEKYILEETQNLLKMVKSTLLKNYRLYLLRNILLKKPAYYHIDSLKRSVKNNENVNFTRTTRSYILNGFWQW